MATTENQKITRTRDTRLPHVDRNAPAYRIIYGVFGGLTPFVRATHVKKSTAHGWLVDGLVPAPRMAHIRAAAAAMKLKLDPALFVPAPERSIISDAD